MRIGNAWQSSDVGPLTPKEEFHTHLLKAAINKWPLKSLPVAPPPLEGASSLAGPLLFLCPEHAFKLVVYHQRHAAQVLDAQCQLLDRTIVPLI